MLIALSLSLRRASSLLRIDHDVLSLGVLVAGDDLVAGHLAMLRADLLVANPAVAGFVQRLK